MVLPRVLTSILLVPFVLAVGWYGSVPFFLFVLGVCVISAWEYSLIADQGGFRNQFLVLVTGAGALTLAYYLDGAPWGPLRKAPGPLFIFIAWTFISFVRELARRDKSLSFLRIVTTVAGIALCGVCLGHLVLIRDLRLQAGGEGFSLAGRGLLFFLIFVIWSVDTGAWFVGRLIGRHPVAPLVSPKKTWEGTIGGTLIACAVGWFCREAFLRDALGPLEAALYAFGIAVAAQISDIAESLLKRSFDVKDSSQLLPGHGGILDRFDSFLFAAPFFYYVLTATGRFQ